MKKFFMFVLALLPWFLSGILIEIDKSYYASLRLPFFIPPVIIFDIIQLIIYILLAYNVIKIYNDYKFDGEAKNYYFILTLNYIFYQLLIPIFFGLNSLFFAFVDVLAIFVSSLWLYYECRKLNNVICKGLIPYLIWNLYATLLIVTIYFMNL
jgi:tryptophan-rich sensory protein